MVDRYGTYRRTDKGHLLGQGQQRSQYNEPEIRLYIVWCFYISVAARIHV